MKQKDWKNNNRKLNVILLQPENQINKPSHLVKQVYSNSLTANQKKTYNFLIRELLKNDKEILESNKIKVKRKEIENFLKVTKYNDLYSDLDKLIKTIITIEDKKTRARSGLISGYIMPKDPFDDDADNQYIHIEFNSKLTKTFHKIEKYIKINIHELRSLKHTHSITLYEILKRQLNNHSNLCKINLTEHELRIYLNIEKNKYSKPSDFHLYVVKRAVKEIQLKTLIELNYERIKITKGVYQYNFSFSQYIDLSLAQFISKLKSLSYYKSITFTIDNINYRFQAVDKDGNYAKDINALDIKILLIKENTTKDKIEGIRRNYFKSKEILSKEESQKIYQNVYDIYLKGNGYIFVYKYFILQDLYVENIKKLDDIPEEYQINCLKYSKQFEK